MTDQTQQQPSSPEEAPVVSDNPMHTEVSGQEDKDVETYLKKNTFRRVEYTYRIYNTETKKDHDFTITLSILPLDKEKEIEAKKTSRLNQLIGDKKGYENQPRRLVEERELPTTI